MYFGFQNDTDTFCSFYKYITVENYTFKLYEKLQQFDVDETGNKTQKHKMFKLLDAGTLNCLDLC